MTAAWPTNSTNCDSRWGSGRIILPNAADDRSCGDSALARRASKWDNPVDAIDDDWKQVELLKTNHVAFRPIDVKMGPDGAIYIADWYNPIIPHGEVDFRDQHKFSRGGIAPQQS